MEVYKSKISGIAKEIKIAEEALLDWKSKDEPIAAVMISQYESLKKDLLKDLLVELVRTGISFNTAGDFIQRLTTYLRNEEADLPLPIGVKQEFAEVERMLAI